jgi:hypothetical protein
MLLIASPASVIPARSAARGSVVDATLAAAGIGAELTLDDAHDTTDIAAAANER